MLGEEYYYSSCYSEFVTTNQFIPLAKQLAGGSKSRGGASEYSDARLSKTYFILSFPSPAHHAIVGAIPGTSAERRFRPTHPCANRGAFAPSADPRRGS